MVNMECTMQEQIEADVAQAYTRVLMVWKKLK